MAQPWPLWLRRFWILFGGTLCLIYGLALLTAIEPRNGRLNDFIQEWTSTKNFWTDDPIYDRLSHSVPRHLRSPYPYAHQVDINGHPPASILAVMPLSAFDFPTAVKLWNIASLAMLCISLYLLLRPKGLNCQPALILPISVFLLMSTSLQEQVLQGQFNLLLLLLIVVAWASAREKTDVIAGISLGLATAIKLFPGYMIVYFAAQRRWKVLIVFGSTLIVTTAFTCAVFGLESHYTYLHKMIPELSQYRNWWANASIPGFWSKLFVASSGHVVPIVRLPWLATLGSVLCISILTSATWLMSSRAKTLAQRDQSFALTVVAMLLASPITWGHYFLLLLLPFLVAWRTSRDHVTKYSLILLLTFLCIINPKHVWDLAISGSGELALDTSRSIAGPLQSATLLSYQMFGLLLLFLIISRQVSKPTPLSIPT